jgi:nitroreductase
MNVLDVIHGRRSIKRFTDRVVSRDEVERLLEGAVQAPNHRMTQPWRFYVLGPESRRAFGAALGERKARRVADAEAGRMVRDKVAAEHAAVPCMIAVATVQEDDPEIREENYAAAMMAVQNILLGAAALGLGGHIKTGAVMSDPAGRAAAGVADDERIVAMINIGEPAEVPAPKERTSAAALTRWQP